MITTKNYYSEVNKIGLETLPETLRKSHDFVNKVTKEGSSWSGYDTNETFKRVIDKYISKLNDYLAIQKKKTVVEPKKQTAVKPKKTVVAKEKKYFYDGQSFTEQGIIDFANTTLHYEIQDSDAEPITDAESAIKALKAFDKAPKQSKKSKQPTGTPVERINDDIALIKRFLNFHNKRKSKEQVINLLKSIKKAILEKRVSKNSLYGPDVIAIHDKLVTLSKDSAEAFEITISDENLSKYKEIASSVSPMPSISLLKRYVGLIGKKDGKEKAERLLKHYQHALDKGIISKSDTYYNQISTSFENLKDFISKGEKSLKITQAELNGLKGMRGLGNPFAFAISAITATYLQNHIKTGVENIQKYFSKKSEPEVSPTAIPHNVAGLGGAPEVMSVSDVKQASYEEIGFTGDLKKLLGAVCAPTSIFIYGNGGSGKSGLSLKIADFLSQKNLPVLYVAGEQFKTPSFTRLINATGIKGGRNFVIVRTLNDLPIQNYSVIVIDSKESAGLLNSSQFVQLRDNNPNKIWIITSQGTKAGDYAGDGKWLNECEVFVYCENGIASTIGEKNRWGGKDKIKLY